MAQGPINPTIPTKNFKVHKEMSSSQLLFSYTDFMVETVKLNIHLRQKLHSFATDQWTMP
jgi:hypothetical protein